MKYPCSVASPRPSHGASHSVKELIPLPLTINTVFLGSSHIVLIKSSDKFTTEIFLGRGMRNKGAIKV